LATLHSVDELVQTNASPLSTAISNLVNFSEQLETVTEELRVTFSTNRLDVTEAIQNVKKGTVQLSELLTDLQSGKGLMGGILKDEQLRENFASTVSNLNIV